MFPSLSSRALSPARRLVSALAMSAALVGGSMMLAAPAAAQDYSDNFVKAYQPVQTVVSAEGGDIASVSGQFPAILAAAETADDKFAAGNLLLMAGNKATNAQWQRQGLELMVASGKAPPEQLGQFQFFIGNLAYNAQDYAAARTALEAAQTAGYSAPDADIPGLIAESYFAEGNGQAGIDYIKQASERLQASGGQVPERWLLKALQTAYNEQLVGPATEISTLLVSTYPTEQNWKNALQVVGALNEFEPQQQLDFLRLMRETKVMSDRNEYVRYIEAADPRIMSNEVQGVLADAVAAGQLSASDTYYTEVKSIADQRAAADQSEIGNLVSEAQGSAEPERAVEAGDVAWSLSDFAQAEAMYQLALDKGIADRDTALTRLGMSQTKQGKYAEAQATLEQVGGTRAPIAQMWALYAQTRAG